MELEKLPRIVKQFYVNFQKYENEFRDKPVRFMEIGVFLGNTMMLLVKNFLTHPDARYVGIDPWDFEGTSRIKFPDNDHGRWRFAQLLKNLKKFKDDSDGRVELYRGLSQNILRDIYFDRQSFDLIYIDGKHTIPAVMTDFALTWPLLKIGGIMVFDDYGCRDSDEVKLAADLLLFGLQERGNMEELNSRRALIYEIPRRSKIELLEKNYQVWIRKLAE